MSLLDDEFQPKRNDGHRYANAIWAAAMNSAGCIAANELHCVNPFRHAALLRSCRQGEHSGWWKRLVLRGLVGLKR